jgi:dephospho-CoA kinase
MFLIGLTGGIAAGKSTVARCWVNLGGIEIDADQLARDVVEPGTEGFQRVREAFGERVIQPNGELDRSALAALVFDDPLERKKLEAIIHPMVQEVARKLMSDLPANSMVIYNVPLLVEAQVGLEFDEVVTVEAPLNVRLARLVADRGMTPAAAKARIEAQASSAQRANAASHILNSNQDLHLLLRDATALWRTFEREATGGTN